MSQPDPDFDLRREFKVRFPHPLLTVDEAAALARVPKKTIYHWHSRGLLQGLAMRCGRYLRLKRDVFIDHVLGQSN